MFLWYTAMLAGLFRRASDKCQIPENKAAKQPGEEGPRNVHVTEFLLGKVLGTDTSSSLHVGKGQEGLGTSLKVRRPLHVHHPARFFSVVM